jgi:DNA-binding NarL/FixJ family response regulator
VNSHEKKEDSIQPYSIMVADDHGPFRRDLKRILTEGKDIRVVGEAGDGLELLDLFMQHSSKPDMVILDITMPNLSGIEAVRRIKRIDPGVKILILTIHKEREYLDQAISAGAEGYLLKEDADAEIFSAIQTIQQGQFYLSPFFSRE